MEAVVCFDQSADFFRFHLKNHVFKRLNHHVTREKAEITPVGCRTRILRMLLGELCKALWRLPYLREQLFGLGARRGFFFSRAL